VIRDTVRGVAKTVEGSGNRRFQVAFGPGVARFVQRLLKPEDNYRIYCLGPEVGGRHAWAVVGGDGKDRNVFLLARGPSVPQQVKADMTACARKHGLPVARLISRQSRGGN
jgi:lipocalin